MSAYRLAKPIVAPNSWPVTCVTGHAIARCQQRTHVSRKAAIRRICRILRGGSLWYGNDAIAVRDGIECVGISMRSRDRGLAVVTTYFYLTRPDYWWQVQRAVLGLGRSAKPGRLAARQRRQREHGRYSRATEP